MYKIIKFSLIISVLVLSVFTHFFSNCWLLLTDSQNDLPKQSNLFTFQPTQIDSGSGAYWRYAEDHKNYYYFSEQQAQTYYVMPKQKTCKSFNSVDFSTWCQPQNILHKVIHSVII